MKRETLRHPKTLDLASRLNCSRPEALGYLMLLWDWTAETALAGNIGKWPNGAIARACDWTGDPDVFIEALVAARWIDDDAEHRLVIHDWSQHCENWVRAKAQKLHVNLLGTAKGVSYESDLRAGLKSGSFPRDRTEPNRTEPIQTEPNQSPQETNAGFEFLLKSGETWILPSEKLIDYQTKFPGLDLKAELRKASDWCAKAPPSKRPTDCNRFLQNWLNKSKPPGWAQITDATLRSTSDMLAWFDAQSAIPNTYENKLWTLAAVERALDPAVKATNPAALFVALGKDLAGGDHSKLSDEQYDRAKRRLREHGAQQNGHLPKPKTIGGAA